MLLLLFLCNNCNLPCVFKLDSSFSLIKSPAGPRRLSIRTRDSVGPLAWPTAETTKVESTGRLVPVRLVHLGNRRGRATRLTQSSFDFFCVQRSISRPQTTTKGANWRPTGEPCRLRATTTGGDHDDDDNNNDADHERHHAKRDRNLAVLLSLIEQSVVVPLSLDCKSGGVWPN